MKSVRKEPRLLANVMEAIASFKERQGSTPKQIIEYIANYVKRSKDNPRNVTLQVKKALEHGIHCGLIRQRGGKYSLGLDRKDYAIYKRFRQFTDSTGDCNTCKRRRRSRRRGRRSRRSRRRGRRGRRRASIEEDAAEETDTSLSIAEGTPEPIDKSRRRRRRRGRQGRRKRYYRTRRAPTPIEDSSCSSDLVNKDSKAATPPENRRSDQSKSDYQSKTGSTHQDRNHQSQNQEQDGPVDCGNPDCLCNIKQEEDSPQCLSRENIYFD